MSGPSVLFLCDGGPRIGGGHVLRCLTLAGALTRAGAVCAFVDTPETAPALDAFAPEGLARIARPDRADLIVLDHYRAPLDQETALRRLGRLAVIDDLKRPHDADLVLDPGFGRQPSDYDAPVALAGPDYALVRPEFAALRPAALARRDQPPERALVSLGLTDLNGITGRIVAILLQTVGDLALDVVVGSGAASLPALRSLAAAGRLSLHVDSRDMAALVAGADLAIGAGGSSVWERACLGLPSITLILADNQRDMAMALDEADVTLALDARWPGLDGRLASAWRRLSNPSLARRLSIQSAALCDGLGADRAAAAMLAMLR